MVVPVASVRIVRGGDRRCLTTSPTVPTVAAVDHDVPEELVVRYLQIHVVLHGGVQTGFATIAQRPIDNPVNRQWIDHLR